MFQETHARSIVKAVSWRVLATLTTIVLVYLFVGDPAIALSVGGFEVVLKMLVYFGHERVWDRVRFGRHEIQPFVLWITGLSGAGKTMIGEEVTRRLRARKLKTEHLDGDAVRHLFPATGFTRKEVNDHIRRVGHLASQLEKNGVFVVASFLSPYRESREFVRNICRNYLEVHVSTPIEECRRRDPKGLYAKADRGEVKNLSGVDQPYEEPQNALIVVDTSDMNVSGAADTIMAGLSRFL